MGQVRGKHGARLDELKAGQVACEAGLGEHEARLGEHEARLGEHGAGSREQVDSGSARA